MKTLMMILGGLVLACIAIPLVLWMLGFAIGLLILGIKLAIAFAIIVFIVGIVRRMIRV